MGHVQSTLRQEGRQRQLQGVQRFGLRGQVDVDAVLLHLLRVQPVGLDVLLHVVPLDKSPAKYKVSSVLINLHLSLLVTVRTFVWLLPGVDLPVPVQTAGVGQHLAAVLALHAGLPIGSDFSSPE